MIKFWLATLLLVLATSASAQSILQVDVLVFRQPSWVANKDQAEWPLRPRPEVAAMPLSIAAQSGQVSLLEDAASGALPLQQKMEAQGYRALYQASYRLPQVNERRALAMGLSQGETFLAEPLDPFADPELDAVNLFETERTLTPEALTPVHGWMRVWVDTYLFVELDLAWLVPDPARRDEIEQARRLQEARQFEQPFAASSFGSEASAQSPTPTPFPRTPDTPISGRESVAEADLWPREAVQMFRLAERKRVRLNEIHYFDHPRFGILVRVTEPTTGNSS